MAYAGEAGGGDEVGSDRSGSAELPPRAVWQAVLDDHRFIRTLLDDVRTAAAITRGTGDEAMWHLRRAIFALYTTFIRHQEMEEADVAPILRVFDAWGELRAAAMIREHDEQRTVLAGLVADCERGAKAPADVAERAREIVAVFVVDMLEEEQRLAPLFDESTVSVAQEDG